jgi:ribosomal protein S18 acetylase RimI-like enzyme
MSSPAPFGPDVTRVDFRPATYEDRGFAERLYLDTMRPLLSALDAWDEPAMLEHFRRVSRVEDARIIILDGEAIGWMEWRELADGIELSQLQIRDGFRGRGIGTRLLRDLLAEARARRKPVSLAVVRNNYLARRLYERLGFEVAGEGGYKLFMRWSDEPAVVA